MATALMVRGLRGATTVDADTVEQVTERSQELMRELMERNGLVEDDIVSILFTATGDVHSIFPATAIREIGFGAVPLLCAAEMMRRACRDGMLWVPIGKNPPDPRAQIRVVLVMRAVKEVVEAIVQAVHFVDQLAQHLVG